MKVTAYVRKKPDKNDLTSKATINFRVRTPNKDIRVSSPLTINPYYWDADREAYKSRVTSVSAKEQAEFNAKINQIKDAIAANFRPTCTKVWLEKLINSTLNVKDVRCKSSRATLNDRFEEFLERHPLSDVRKKNFKVVQRSLQRYEDIQRIKAGAKSYRLFVEEVTDGTLEDLWRFLADEPAFEKKYPEVYEKIPEKRMPEKRGRNTLIDCFTRIRTFFKWCQDVGYLTNNPFSKFTVGEATYGTPVYITLDERNKLYDADLSSNPSLAVQRDIFVFQCLIGCRVGDLVRLTNANRIGNAIEYVPNKTRDNRGNTVRVPLNDKALEILARYEDKSRDSLLPFISEQKYNKAIKEAFKAAGIIRDVTVINPKTGLEEQKSISDVASSHMARRTFVGNLYKKVKDPNLVGSMSGHKDGSRAFARYREIDDEIKKELVDLIN